MTDTTAPALKDRLSRAGRVIYATGAISLAPDGDTVSFAWRWWHPLSWVLGPTMFIIAGLLAGFPRAWRDRRDLGFQRGGRRHA